MNIYEFLNSPDVSAHCKKLEHKFSPMEMASIIISSNQPLSKKHEAFRELISNYPDIRFDEVQIKELKESCRNCETTTTGLHDYLQARMVWEDNALLRFQKDKERGGQITYSIDHGSLVRLGVADDIPLKKLLMDMGSGALIKAAKSNSILGGDYATVDKLLVAAHSYWNEKKVGSISITRSRSGSNGPVTAWINYNGEVISTKDDGTENYRKNYPGSFFLMRPEIPVPFQNGDLVATGGIPFILKIYPHNEYSFTRTRDGEIMDNGQAKYYPHDSYGFTYIKDGRVMDNGDTLPHLLNEDDLLFMPDELQYYTDELSGDQRFLNVISDYIKENGKNQNEVLSQLSKYTLQEDPQKSEFEDNKLIDLWLEFLERR